MASKRDLVEAHAFSRRRLVSAFLSGAPGGREVEPVRQTRVVLCGIGLAVLLLAGAALAAILGGGRSPADWLEPGVVISKEEGSRYVVLTDGGDLHPVLNPVSAKLLLGDTEPKVVKQEIIREQPLGAQIGIYGAPDGVPETSFLRPSGWTACTTTRGASKLHIGDRPVAQPVADAGMVVVVDQGKQQVHYLIAPAADSNTGYHRMRLGNADQAGPLLGNLGLDGAREFRVSPAWINLFPEALALTRDSFGLPSGSPRATYLSGDDLRVGQLVRNPSSQRLYLLGPTEPMLLTDFAARVYATVSGAADAIDVDNVAGEPVDALADWPAAAPQPLLQDEACALLEAEPGEAATVQLALEPSEEESAADLASGTDEVAVQPSYGAYVNVGDFGEAQGGSPVLIDMNATRYRLGGEAGVAAEQFGYGSVEPPTVPDAWTEGFECGPELSQEAARRAPDPRAITRCDG